MEREGFGERSWEKRARKSPYARGPHLFFIGVNKRGKCLKQGGRKQNYAALKKMGLRLGKNAFCKGNSSLSMEFERNCGGGVGFIRKNSREKKRSVS